MPRTTDFTVTLAGSESAFKLYSSLPDGTVSEVSKLAILSFCTEATYKLWLKLADHEKADALVLFLDVADSKSYTFLMARVEALSAQKIPVILVELISAAGAAIDYRAMPQYKVLVKKFGIEEKNRFHISAGHGTQAQLEAAIYERKLSALSVVSHAAAGVASSFDSSNVASAGAGGAAAVSSAVLRALSSPPAASTRSPEFFRGAPGPVASSTAAPPIPAAALGWLRAAGIDPEDAGSRAGFEMGMRICAGLRDRDPVAFSNAAQAAGRAMEVMLGIGHRAEVVPFVAKMNLINDEFESLQKETKKLEDKLKLKVESAAVALLSQVNEYTKKLDDFLLKNKCPITSEIMAHPVRVSTGLGKIIFDRESLRELLQRSKAERKEAICPMTREVLTSNHVLISFAEEDDDKKTEIAEGLSQLKIELEELDLAIKAFLGPALDDSAATTASAVMRP